MSTGLLPCPYCGEEPVSRGEGVVMCNNTKELCQNRASVFTLAAWNRRFASLDKNGDKVFVGDKVNYKLPNWKNKFKQCHVTEFRPPFYGYVLTADDDSDYTAEGFLPSEIELVKEAT